MEKAFTFPIKNAINIHEVNNMNMQKLKQEIGEMTDSETVLWKFETQTRWHSYYRITMHSQQS
jgi:hypothetical protein